MQLPTRQQAARRLKQLLRRGSRTVTHPRTERLMLMLTRSCELRCSYCWVGLSEEHYGQPHPGTPSEGRPEGDMSPGTLRAAVDLLMSSPRPELELQAFGGEPLRVWPLLRKGLAYGLSHPGRGGRPLQLQLTTNGMSLSPELLDELSQLPVIVQLSVDGSDRHSRFRRPHLVEDEATRRARNVPTLVRSGVPHFLNTTLVPAAADEAPERYAWAREQGLQAVQINYATGLRWSEEQRLAYLEGLARALALSRQTKSPRLFNWGHEADPVPLCADLIVDVDGSLTQTGALFHEARFPALGPAYRRGHLSESPGLSSRMDLAELYRATLDAYPIDTEKGLILFENMLLGASCDLLVRQLSAG